MLRSIGNRYKQKQETYSTQVVLKRLQDDAEERAAKKKTKAKRARKLLMKEVKNNTEDLRNMKIILVMEMKTLKTVMKQLAPSVIVYREITQRKEIG